MRSLACRFAILLGLVSSPVFLSIFLSPSAALGQAYLWDGFAQNPQHTSLSTVPSQSLSAIRWQETVDQDLIYGTYGNLYVHYGSPMITAGNTVIAPVKTTAYGGFEIQALNGATGAPMWTQTSDYVIPPNAGVWIPPYSPTLTSGGQIYYPGADGTVLRANVASAGSVASTRSAFYGTSAYAANPSAFSNVYIDTPITSNSAGDVYFGFELTGTPTSAESALGLTGGGIARVSASGVGSFVTAAAASGDSSMLKVVENYAPAISPSGSVYVAVNSTTSSTGYLLQLNGTTLATQGSVVPQDPVTNTPAKFIDDGTASPTIGPDGDVYMGVLDNGNTSRGWMEHYSANLATTKTPGGFGWDDTVSIVPASMVPSYHGTSTYLLMTKYNNYYGGEQNMIAILDPNAPVVDNQRNGGTGAIIMQTVLTQLGPTPNPQNGGVYEWCDNDAVVDPATDSILVTSEDGNLYRWNLATGTITETLSQGSGLGEAYTSTLIGPDGTVYATNNGVLSGIGLTLSTWNGAAGSNWNSADTNWAVGSPAAAGNYGDGAEVIFGDKDPLTGNKVPNVANLVTVTVQAGGVQPAWVTFTNTGAAAGGVDYTIGGGPIMGTAGITLAGTGGVGGAVYLTSPNSFIGGVAVNAGRLNLQDPLALGNSSGVLVSYGAALELQSSGGTPFTFGLTASGSNPIPLALSGSGISGAGALNSVAGNNTYAGPISVGLGSGGATIASTSMATGDLLTLSGGVSVAQGTTLTFIGPGNTTISGSGPVLATATPADGNATLAMQGPGTLEIDAAPTLGDSSALAISGGTLRFKVMSGTATVGVGVTAMVSSGGVLELAGSVAALSAGAGGNQANVVNNSTAAAGLLVSGMNQQVGTVTGSGNTVVADAASLSAYQIRQNSLSINGSGFVTLIPSGSGSAGNPTGPNNVNFSSAVNSLSIASSGGNYTGTLDIGNNGLVIAYGSSSDPYAQVAAMIRSGYNNGLWTGTGITSSLARAAEQLGSPTPQLNIGLLDFTPGQNSDATFIVFEGQTITTNAVLVRLTYMDDLVLAGDMSSDNSTSDALLFAANFGAGTTWALGNLTHNPAPDDSDYTSNALLFAANYAVGLPSLDGATGGDAMLGGGTLAVPEPASLLLAALGFFGALASATLRR